MINTSQGHSTAHAGSTPNSHQGGPSSVPAQVMKGVVVEEMATGRFSLSASVFLQNVHSIKFSTFSNRPTMDQLKNKLMFYVLLKLRNYFYCCKNCLFLAA
jgi:hypothetical protein